MDGWARTREIDLDEATKAYLKTTIETRENASGEGFFVDEEAEDE